MNQELVEEMQKESKQTLPTFFFSLRVFFEFERKKIGVRMRWLRGLRGAWVFEGWLRVSEWGEKMNWWLKRVIKLQIRREEEPN